MNDKIPKPCTCGRVVGTSSSKKLAIPLEKSRSINAHWPLSIKLIDLFSIECLCSATVEYDGPGFLLKSRHLLRIQWGCVLSVQIVHRCLSKYWTCVHYLNPSQNSKRYCFYKQILLCLHLVLFLLY